MPGSSRLADWLRRRETQDTGLPLCGTPRGAADPDRAHHLQLCVAHVSAIGLKPSGAEVGGRCGARSLCCALRERRVRPHGDLVLQLPQPSLPEVPSRQPSARVDGGAQGRAARGPLLPYRFHVARRDRSHRLRSAFQAMPQGWTFSDCPETLRPEPALPHNSPDHERRSYPEEEQRQ